MGYRDEQEFAAAIQREFDQMQYHSDQGKKQKPKPQKALRGKPGSPERLQQVAHLAGTQNRNLMHDVGRSLHGQEIYRAVKEVQQNPSAEAIQQAAELVAMYEDVNVARAAIQALSPTGYGDHFVGALRDAAEAVEHMRDYDAEEWERQRLEDRQRLLHEEYAQASNNPEVAEAIDNVAQQMGDDLYDPALDDLDVAAMLRTTGYLARRQQYANNSFRALAALDDELLRYGPGSSTSDEHRGKWEGELRQSSLEVFDRHSPKVGDAVEDALDSIEDDITYGDKSALEQGLDQEIKNMAEHHSDSEHRNWMREESVRDWNEKFDSSGRPKQ
jgi:hypothetical protein